MSSVTHFMKNRISITYTIILTLTGNMQNIGITEIYFCPIFRFAIQTLIHIGDFFFNFSYSSLSLVYFDQVRHLRRFWFSLPSIFCI